MKKVIKGAEPQLLAAYKVATPQNSWEQYTKKKNRKVLVQDRLKSDQSGLCAYCEINLLEKDSAGDADFRVEHFHPKSDTSTAHNWHLDWQNLLGCCHGGSQSNVTSSTIRFTSLDHSCDVPKEDKNLDGIILNPLTDVPAYPSIFKCDRTSEKLTAHSENCISANISDAIVQQTIDELRLDAGGVDDARITGPFWIFIAANEYNGDVKFTYTVEDDGTTNGADDFLTDTGEISVVVQGVNDTPIVDGDNVTGLVGENAGQCEWYSFSSNYRGLNGHYRGANAAYQ